MAVHHTRLAPHCAACDSTNVRPHSKDLWLCQDCEELAQASLGMLPALADARLHRLRHRCHKALDALWLDSPTTTRSDAYDAMRTNTGVTHIGSTTVEDCERVLAWLDSL